MLSDEKGFTFIELIIVLVILIILVTAASAYFVNLQEQINATACRANQMNLIKAQNLYYTHYYLNENQEKFAEELEELIPFTNQDEIPECPSQGSYILEEHGNVTCSLPEHERIK